MFSSLPMGGGGGGVESNLKPSVLQLPAGYPPAQALSRLGNYTQGA